jgi:hypothetical protein
MVVNMENNKEKTKKTTKSYGIGTFVVTFFLCVIFALVGAAVGGLTGFCVGLALPLVAHVCGYCGLIPFVGVFFYIPAFNMFFDWLYSVIPSMGVLLAPDALPRVILFWIFLVISAVATILMSIVVVILVVVALAYLFDKT